MALPHKENTFTDTLKPSDELKPGHYLRAKDLAKRLGLSVNTIWRLSKQDKFPKPIKLSEKVTVWKSSDVLSWLASKEAA